MILGEVNGLFTLFDRIISEWSKRRTKGVTSVSRRFIELFEAHGVKRNQIPRFFGHGITLGDLANDGLLLVKLTEPVLEAACSLFGVRREWLDGAGEEPYRRHDFYKAPENFEQFIEGLKAENPDAELDGYLIVSEDAASDDKAALILMEVVGEIGDSAIYRYHYCDDWVFDYWKSRAYLTACIAIAWKRKVFIKGRRSDRRELCSLTEQQALPGPILKRLTSSDERWYAEDLALLPDRFLEGLDAEQNSFGVISALRLWLRLDSQGWMDTGLRKDVRQVFEEELAKHEARSAPELSADK